MEVVSVLHIYLICEFLDVPHGRRFVAPQMMLPVGRVRVGVQGAVTMMESLTVEA